MVLDRSVDRLQGAITNGEYPIADDVSLLLRENRSKPARPELSDSLQPVISARDSGGDESRDRGWNVTFPISRR